MQRRILTFELDGEKSTESLAKVFGNLLQPGSVVLLKGDLGAGKTVFARGLAKGLGVDEEYVVTSPTFTLLNVYPGKIPFFHADIYRLSQEEVMDLELLEEATQGVLAVEWPERAIDVWPLDSVLILIGRTPSGKRKIQISGPEDLLDKLDYNQEKQEN